MNTLFEAYGEMLQFSNYTQAKVEKFTDTDFEALVTADSLPIKKAWFSVMVMGVFLGFMVQKYGEDAAMDAFRQVSAMEREQQMERGRNEKITTLL